MNFVTWLLLAATAYLFYRIKRISDQLCEEATYNELGEKTMAKRRNGPDAKRNEVSQPDDDRKPD